MMLLGKSQSAHGRRSNKSDTHASEREPAAIRHRPSFDTFVIQRRTRYPSNQVGPPQPTNLDIQVTASLLGHHIDASASKSANDIRSSDSLQFTERYNEAARELGLSELSASSCDHGSGVALSEQSRGSRSWLLQRLSRKSSFCNLVGSYSDPPKHSLDDLCRLGGLNLLRLPHKYVATQLLIPAGIAATGNFLVHEGKGASGIFRIPGQASAVNTLYLYLTSQLRTIEEPAESIQMTIRANDIPQDLAVDVHDVASTFKRFLRNLPGGILGSVELFRALKEINDLCVGQAKAPQEDATRAQLGAQLIALRLLSIEFNTRFALIGAIFGLLAYLKQDDHLTPVTALKEAIYPDKMDSHALSVVFAPLLLGDLTDSIDANVSHSSPAKETTPSPGPKRKLLHVFKTSKISKRPNNTECSPEITASLDKYNTAVTIVEMLTVNWEIIVQEIRAIAPQFGTRFPSFTHGDHAQVPVSSLLNGQLDGAHPGLRSRLKSARSSSLLKSMSQPSLGTCLHLETNANLAAAMIPAMTRSISEYLQPVNELMDSPIRQKVKHQASVPRAMPHDNSAFRLDYDDMAQKPAGPKDHYQESSSGSVITRPYLHAEFPASAQDFGSITAGAVDTSTTADSGFALAHRTSPHITFTSDADEKYNSSPIGPFEAVLPRQRGSPYLPITHTAEQPPHEAHTSPVSRLPAAWHTPEHGDVPHFHSEPHRLDNRNGRHLRDMPGPNFHASSRLAVSGDRANRQPQSFIPKPVSNGKPRHPGRGAPTQGSRDFRGTQGSEGIRSTGTNSFRDGRSAYHHQMAPSDRALQSVLNLPRSRPQHSPNMDRSLHGELSRAQNHSPNNDVAHDPRRVRERTDSSNYISDDLRWQQPENRKNVALFTQIRRLNNVVVLQQEQIVQLRQELDAVRQCRDAATSEKLKDTERQLRHYKGELEVFRKRWYGQDSSER